MKAMVYDHYGPPDVLELRDVEEPALTDDGALVRVRASSVNPYDWHMVTGLPYLARTSAGLRRPKTGLVGVDFAGVVEAVGKDVDHVRPGDEVFGARNGAFAEYVCVRKAVALKPAHVTFEQAAAVPLAAITALQALRDKVGSSPARRSSSTVHPAVSAPSRSSSRRHSGRTSRACAARATSTWCTRSVRTA
jgi:NADPH:quinone reductase-like Zn-dependent oxidoreductase